MYKREVTAKGKKYYFYYYNIRENGKVKNVCLGSDLKKANKKLSELKKRNHAFKFMDFLWMHKKNVLLLSLIFLTCLAYGLFFNSTNFLTGFATYEVTVDASTSDGGSVTLKTTLNATADASDVADFGVSVATGDINNDGYADLVIGDNSVDGSGFSDAGQVFVFFGTADGIQNMNSLHANITLNGTIESGTLGTGVATGDVNMDGFSDIIAAASDATVSAGSEGIVYVSFGADYTEKINMNIFSYANITLNGTQGGSTLGRSVAAGDVNNDSYADVIAGAYGHTPTEVLVFFGANYTSVINVNAEPYANLTLNGTETISDWFGYSVGSGDVNNDTYADIIVSAQRAAPSGATDAGQAFVFFGADFTEIIHPTQNASEYANITLNGTAPDWFGRSVAAGDVNNDGYADIITSAYNATPSGIMEAGQVFVFFGADYSTAVSENAFSYANITLNGTSAYDYLGYQVSKGDINRDNYSDILVGAYNATAPGGIATGQAFVFFGANYTTIINEIAGPYANITVNGTSLDDSLGAYVASGDIENDSYSDFIISATLGDTPDGNDFGQVYIYEYDDDVPTISLEFPEDNTTNTTTNIIDFTYNVSEVNSLVNCSLIIENSGGSLSINVTDTAMQKDTLGQNLTTYLYNGEYNWSVNCTDSFNNIGASETRNVTLNIYNALPTCTQSDTNITVDEDSNLGDSWVLDDNMSQALNISCSDADSDALFYNITSPSIGNLAGNGTYGIYGLLNNDILNYTLMGLNVSGAEQAVVINVSDGISGDVFISVNITISAVNDAPWWNETSNTTYSYNEDFGTDYTIWDEDGLNNTFQDVEDNNLPYNCTAEANGTNIVSNVRYNGSIIADSVSNAFGNFILTVNCSDYGGFSELTSFEINITDVAEPPETPSGGGGDGGAAAPAPAPPIPVPPKPVQPTIPTPPPAPEVPPEAPPAEAVPEIITPLEIDSPEAVVSAEDAHYELVKIEPTSFGEGIRIEISGSRNNISELVTIYVVIEDKKPKFVINFDGGECDYDCPHCYNKVKDGDEEGVDCGGSCITDCQGQIKLPVSAFECGDGICSAGEECFCNKDCGRIKCIKLTFDFENVLSWLLIFLLIISACIVTFPTVISKLREREPYFDYDKVLQDIQIIKKLRNLNFMLDTLQMQFRERKLRTAFSTYQGIRELYKTLPDDQKRHLYPRILLILAKKPKTVEEQKFEKFNQLVNKFETELERKNYENAISTYERIKKGCKELSLEEQKKIYLVIFPRIISQLKNLSQKSGYKKTMLKEVDTIESIIKIEGLLTELQNSYETKDYERAKQVYEQIRQEHEKLPLNERLRINQKLKNILKRGGL